MRDMHFTSPEKDYIENNAQAWQK